MAVPVACLHGPGLRAGRDQGRQRHLLDRLAEAALRAERHRRAPSACRSRRCAAIWVVGPGSYGRNDADDCRHGRRRAGEGGRQAGARAVYARPGHRLGPEGPGLDPPRPRRDRRIRQGHRLRVPQQGLLAHRRQHQRRQARGHARGTFPRRRAEIRRQFRRAGGILRVRQQAHCRGRRSRRLLDRASPLRGAHLRDPVGPQIHFASESFMDEVAAALDVDPVEFRLRHVKDAARHRGAQGRGREGGLAVAALAAQGPDRQQGERPRHRLFAAQRHALRRSSPRSTSTARPARSGRASSPSRTTAARSSTRTASSTPSRATSCRGSAARCGRRSSSTPRA